LPEKLEGMDLREAEDAYGRLNRELRSVSEAVESIRHTPAYIKELEDNVAASQTNITHKITILRNKIKEMQDGGFRVDGAQEQLTLLETRHTAIDVSVATPDLRDTLSEFYKEIVQALDALTAMEKTYRENLGQIEVLKSDLAEENLHISSAADTVVRLKAVNPASVLVGVVGAYDQVPRWLASAKQRIVEAAQLNDMDTQQFSEATQALELAESDIRAAKKARTDVADLERKIEAARRKAPELYRQAENVVAQLVSYCRGNSSDYSSLNQAESVRDRCHELKHRAMSTDTMEDWIGLNKSLEGVIRQAAEIRSDAEEATRRRARSCQSYSCGNYGSRTPHHHHDTTVVVMGGGGGNYHQSDDTQRSSGWGSSDSTPSGGGTTDSGWGGGESGGGGASGDL
jgi:uncharacterized membrane protein YgcG